MKIAATSQNFRTVTAHAGKKRRFLVFATKDGALVETARLDLPPNRPLCELGNREHPIDEVAVLITRSAGAPLVGRLRERGIDVVISVESDPLLAVAQPRQQERSRRGSRGAGGAALTDERDDTERSSRFWEIACISTFPPGPALGRGGLTPCRSRRTGSGADRPASLILLAPPSVGFIAYVGLTDELDAFARLLYYTALFLTLLLASNVARFIRAPFFVSAWAYAFPLAATIATFVMYGRTRGVFFVVLAGVLLLALTGIVVALATRTARAARQHALCVPE